MKKYAEEEELSDVSLPLPIDVEIDLIKGMIESMTGVNSRMVMILKKRLEILEYEEE